MFRVAIVTDGVSSEADGTSTWLRPLVERSAADIEPRVYDTHQARPSAE